MKLSNRQWVYALDVMEIKVRAKISANRNKFIKQAANAYSKDGIIPTRIVIQHQKRLNDILASHYKLVIPYFAQKALPPDFKSNNSGLEYKKLSTFTSVVADWISRESLRKAKMISETDFDDINNAIEKGLLEGGGISEISTSIRDVSGLSAYRSQVVARTETHNAATYAAITKIRDVEEVTGAKFQKQWIVTRDNRTRESHAAMNSSEWIDSDEKFIVGGEALDRAGDPTGSAENVINCRCQVIFRSKTNGS